MRFRCATEKDRDALIAIAREIAEAPQWSACVWGEALAALLTQSTQQRVVLLVEENADPLGFAVVSAVADVATVESIAVVPEHQQKGVGRRLMQEAEAWARQRGALSMQLEVRVSNQAARALYRAMGFEEVARRPGYYQSPQEDAVLLELRIDGSKRV